jgi:hypothetical protein
MMCKPVARSADRIVLTTRNRDGASVRLATLRRPTTASGSKSQYSQFSASLPGSMTIRQNNACAPEGTI